MSPKKLNAEEIADLREVIGYLEGGTRPGDAPMSLAEAVQALHDELPGFWWRGGTCALSSEAIVCPDHNDPEHRERLMAECPPSVKHWNEGIEVELRPGSDAALVRALLAAMSRAILLKNGMTVIDEPEVEV